MNFVPFDIIYTIFNNIYKFTDKRQFVRTCTKINNYCKNMIKLNIEHFDKIEEHCIEKFTLELCHDAYFDKIPISYINPNNKIIIKALAYYNCTELLEIAKNNGCNINDGIDYALIKGNLDVVKWLKCNNIYIDKYDFGTIAGKFGHLHLLEWAKENILSRKTSDYICINAAENGYLDVLIWCKTNEMYINRPTIINLMAAQNGHLDILIWLKENDYKFNPNKTIGMCSVAASNGHLNVIKWLRANGCYWDKDVLIEAKKNGHMDVFNWAKDNGCPE